MDGGVVELALDFGGGVFGGSGDALAGVGGVFEGVPEVDDLVHSYIALVLDHDVAGLDVPVTVAESLHFGKEADHLAHEFPESFLVVGLSPVLGELSDFLLESPVAELNDDTHFEDVSLLCVVLIPVIVVEDLNY